MRKNFMLNNQTAIKLYNDYAKNLPIIDYHNHLSLQSLQDDTAFENITKLWISPDPYKHRLMRICGIDEKYITGNSSDYEKFVSWCKIFPMLLGTPVYDWCKAELDYVFDLDISPSEQNCDFLWNTLNEKTKKITPSILLKKFNAEYIAPCHGICDNLDYYIKRTDSAPSLRCDEILCPSKDFTDTLASVTQKSINTFDDYCASLEIRLEYFRSAGLKFADIALDNGFVYVKDFNPLYYEKALTNQATENEINSLKSNLILFLSGYCAKHKITLQLHIGAQRSTSDKLCSRVGKAGGFSAIGNDISISGITALLNDIETVHGCLPKIILFTLNPSYNALFSVLSGSYSADGMCAVVTQGPAWWWCDHKYGIEQFLNEFSAYSVLSTFVGMTTDSRSFLSFVRHDYFRRILCSWLGDKAEKGEYPKDYELLGKILSKICYYNAKELI